MFCIQIATLDSSDLYNPYYWEMNRRDLMSSHYCGPQTVGILRNYQKLMSIGLVSSGLTNQERECLRQEPYLVLASTTTILLDVPVELNFCYGPTYLSRLLKGQVWSETPSVHCSSHVLSKTRDLDDSILGNQRNITVWTLYVESDLSMWRGNSGSAFTSGYW